MTRKTIGTTPFSISIVSRNSKKNTLKEPELLKAMDRFEEWFRNDPHGTYVISFADFLKNLNFHIWEMEKDKYRIPDTKGRGSGPLFRVPLRRRSV